MKLRIRKNHLGSLAIFTSAFIWGTSFVMMKDVTEKLPPSLLLAIRFTTAFVILSLLFFKKMKKLNKSYIGPGILIGFFLFLAYTVQTYGISLTTPGKNAFLTASYCVITPFLLWMIAGKRPDRYHLISTIVCLCGILMISVDFGKENMTVGLGDLLTLLCGVFYAAHIVAISLSAQDKDPVLVTILQFGVAGILSWALFGTLSIFHMAPLSAKSADIGSLAVQLLYLSILCTAAAIFLQNYGLKYANPTGGAVIMTFESVFGALFSLLLGREEGFDVWRGVGFLLMFVAVIISETKLSFLHRNHTIEMESEKTI